jgi:hypothetical protein
VTDRLHPDDIEAIARAVAEILRQDGPPATGELLTAADVAQRFGVTRQWAYQHAGQLGALRLGDGPKARLRFDPAKVTAALDACSLSRQPQEPQTRSVKPNRRPRARRSIGTEVELLPIRGTSNAVGTPPSLRHGG